MLVNERQNIICEMLRQKGAVTTSELVSRFKVSIETIRRDLLFLEKERMLQRVHGGAVLISKYKEYSGLSARVEENRDKKAELSELAMHFIKNDDTIAIDSGSTAVEFVEALKNHFESLTIVTHSMDVFEKTHDFKNFKTILIGGQYLKEERAFIGTIAVDMLKRLHLKKVFIFPMAVSLKFGIADFTLNLAGMQRQLYESGEEIFILADSSKIEKTSLFTVMPISRDYVIITDSGLSEDVKNMYREENYKIISCKEDFNRTEFEK